MPRHYVRRRFDHPTTQYKDMTFVNRKTRPLTLHAANKIMNACFVMLKAFKSDPPDAELLALARDKAEDALRVWKNSNGNPPKWRKNASRPQQPARIEDPDTGSQP